MIVRDNGPGIDAEHLDKIFDPFFTTKDVGEGMGLGLSICYRIVQECEGKISVAHRAGKVLRVYAGVSRERMRSKREILRTVMEHLYDYKKFAILYVDDEEKSLKNFARAFERPVSRSSPPPTPRRASSCSRSTRTTSAC